MIWRYHVFSCECVTTKEVLLESHRCNTAVRISTVNAQSDDFVDFCRIFYCILSLAFSKKKTRLSTIFFINSLHPFFSVPFFYLKTWKDKVSLLESRQTKFLDSVLEDNASHVRCNCHFFYCWLFGRHSTALHTHGILHTSLVTTSDIGVESRTRCSASQINTSASLRFTH